MGAYSSLLDGLQCQSPNGIRSSSYSPKVQRDPPDPLQGRRAHIPGWNLSNYSGKLQFCRMILSGLLAALSFLVQTSTAAVPSLCELEGNVGQLSIKDDTFAEAAELYNPLSSLEDIISQGDALRAETLNDDIETVVSKLNQRLLDLLNSGITLLGAAPIINCFFFDAEELVLAAKRVQAHTLLKILHLIYIWRDDVQFHWFQALSYQSPWYDQTMWNTHPMDWEKNLWAIFTWDNGALAMAIQKTILSRDDLNSFNEKLLVLCVEYDAINVFRSTRLDFFQLEKHLELMAANCSVKLLHHYQLNRQIKHLGLDRFGFPEKLPGNTNDFAYLLNHGHEYLSMDQHIKSFCKKGRLDLLIYLQKLNPKLVPDKDDLMVVAEEGWLDILQWSRNLIQNWQISKDVAVKLAVNEHFKALEWLINEYNLIFDSDIITEIIVVGKLETLHWIYEKQPFEYKQRWADLAAENRCLPVLKWIAEVFNYIPSTHGLRNATAEMLDWKRAIRGKFINKDLVKYGAGNFELLKWVYKNAPISIFNDHKLAISLGIHNKSMMKWLYTKLKISPARMDWAYIADDLEAIQWALENCQILPTIENIAFAIEGGNLNIIKWIHENYPEYLEMSEALKLGGVWGSMEMVDYIIANFMPGKVLTFDKIGKSAHWSLYPDALDWNKERRHFYTTDFLVQNMELFASSGQLQPFLCLVKAYSSIQPPTKVWDLVVSRGHHEVYKWYMKTTYEYCKNFKPLFHIQLALANGQLEMVKLILHKCPKLFKEISVPEVTRLNYHVVQWLDINSKLPKKSIFKSIFTN